MAKAIKLKKNDVNWINSRGKGGTDGHLVELQFAYDENMDPKKWAHTDLGDFVRSLMNPYQAKSLEVWVTSTNVRILVWARSPQVVNQIKNGFLRFNQDMMVRKASTYFPTLTPEHHTKVLRLRPRRNPHHQFLHIFGNKGLDWRVSPIVQILNAIPEMPDGSQMMLQIIFRRNAYYWKYNPFCYMEFTPGYKFDQEAIDMKSHVRDTYYVDIRIMETHADKRHLKDKYAEQMAHTFEIYDLKASNGLEITTKGINNRRRIIRFINAMQDRNVNKYRHRGIKKPHLSCDEIGAMFHPPPYGQTIPRIATTTLKPTKDNSIMRDRAAGLNEAIKRAREGANVKKPGLEDITRGGRARRMSASEANKIMKRRGIDLE